LATAIIKKEYQNNMAFIDVAGVISSASNEQTVTFNGISLVDTGFDKGIFLPKKYLKDLEATGVTLFTTPVTYADGSEGVAFSCVGVLRKIDNYTLKTEKDIIILINEKDIEEHMIITGMETLQYFTVVFEGIKQVFSVIEEN
jgi:predicted aspartyl protease